MGGRDEKRRRRRTAAWRVVVCVVFFYGIPPTTTSFLLIDDKLLLMPAAGWIVRVQSSSFFVVRVGRRSDSDHRSSTTMNDKWNELTITVKRMQHRRLLLPATATITTAPSSQIATTDAAWVAHAQQRQKNK
jgi:hypothetical protein